MSRFKPPRAPRGFSCRRHAESLAKPEKPTLHESCPGCGGLVEIAGEANYGLSIVRCVDCRMVSISGAHPSDWVPEDDRNLAGRLEQIQQSVRVWREIRAAADVRWNGDSGNFVPW